MRKPSSASIQSNATPGSRSALFQPKATGIAYHLPRRRGHRNLFATRQEARLKMTNPIPTRAVAVGAGFLALLFTLGISQAFLERTAAAQTKGAIQAPRFEVDPLWPKPLPNHWLIGSAIGVWVDADDHIWIIHRSSATLGNNEKTLETKQGDCCAGAPPVLEFDQAGNLLRHWGGPGEGYEWPDSNHGIFVDYKGRVREQA
jgi:hypothetical protein